MDLKYDNIILPGTYGDREVRLCHCLPAYPNGIQVVLLHGVHSSANMGVHNKFRHLAELLSMKGYAPWLVETSRKIRNRYDFADDIDGWIKNAFDGKTFLQEQEDVFIAIRRVLSVSSGCPLWLWGFSLGGIIAVSAAASGAIVASNAPDGPVIDKIILSGTGLNAYEKVEDAMMTMPVLSTLRTSIPYDITSDVKTGGVISFRGSDDEIFSEASCRDLVRKINISEDLKYFYTVQGANHSLRDRNGRSDPGIMEEMVDYIVKIWG